MGEVSWQKNTLSKCSNLSTCDISSAGNGRRRSGIVVSSAMSFRNLGQQKDYPEGWGSEYSPSVPPVSALSRCSINTGK